MTDSTKAILIGSIIKDPSLVFDDNAIKHFPCLQAMHGFDQENPHHHLSLMGHTLMVVHGVDRPVLKVAALYHDAGKVQTKVMKDGKATYHGHDKVGAEMLRKELDGVFSDCFIHDAALICELHMRPLGYINQPFSDKGVRRLIRKANGFNVTIEDLLDFNKADIEAHTPSQVEKCMKGHDKLRDHVWRVMNLA